MAPEVAGRFQHVSTRLTGPPLPPERKELEATLAELIDLEAG
jgi:hypothetical protein